MEGWTLPGGTRLHNTGSWLHEEVFLGGLRDPRNPYFPGGVTLLRDAGPPELVHVLRKETSSMTADELRRRVAEISWYHSIDLGEGVVTPGIDRDPRRLERMHLPTDLGGRTVLDIGAWDGYYSSRRSAAAPNACWPPTASPGG